MKINCIHLGKAIKCLFRGVEVPADLGRTMAFAPLTRLLLKTLFQEVGVLLSLLTMGWQFQGIRPTMQATLGGRESRSQLGVWLSSPAMPSSESSFR